MSNPSEPCTPMQATNDEICAMKTDHVDVEDFMLMTDGDDVWLIEQKRGKRPTQKFAINKRAFNELIKWYTSPQEVDPPCECGCCHSTDYGACNTFEEGGNGRCVYCDHGLPCHERDKNRPFFNGPLSPGRRKP